ncbi:hypothetical protein ABZX92_30875 [Lentzea sp. NPDC006480]|uniref:hypothetical protein n=1 Tax=Lentzea sp. NPDC006480 TaxID=3157176 RepID=UPI00339F9EA2
MKTELRLLAAVAGAAFALTGMVAVPAAAQPQDEMTIQLMCSQYPTSKQVTRSEVLARSLTWLVEKPAYNQGACHDNQYGNYRTDCSGFVSMSWGLNYSHTTYDINTVSKPIAWTDLRPGDALNDWDSHIALFMRWADANKTMPVVREHAGGGPPIERTWSAGEASSYVPIRYNNIIEDSGEPAPAGDYGIAASSSIRYMEQQHTFQRGQDGYLNHFWYTPGVPVNDYETLWGAKIVGEPAAYVYNNQQHVFARGEDNSLKHWWYNPGSGWSSETWTGGSVAGTPTGFAHGNQQHVFARGTDGQLHHWFYSPVGGRTHEVLGGDIDGDPTAFVHTNQQHVYAKAADGTLRHWWYSPDAGWRTEKLGGSITGAPSGFAHDYQQHVYARTADGRLGHWYYSPTGGNTYEVIAGGSVAGDPVAFKFGEQQQVFARTTDGRLHHWYHDPATGQNNEDWGGGELAGDPSAFAYHDQQHVFIRHRNNSLSHFFYRTGAAVVAESWKGNIS